jgi:excisionase family DNA binding protein
VQEFQLEQPYLTVDQVAATLSLSRDTVIRLFEGRKGTLIIEKPESRFTRKYRTIRIPKEVLQSFIVEHRVQ